MSLDESTVEAATLEWFGARGFAPVRLPSAISSRTLVTLRDTLLPTLSSEELGSAETESGLMATT